MLETDVYRIVALPEVQRVYPGSAMSDNTVKWGLRLMGWACVALMVVLLYAAGV